MLSPRCVQHAERDAVGVCVQCRAPVCAECVTRLDGINHCVRCLTRLREEPVRHAPSTVATRGLAAVLARAGTLCAVYALVLGALLLLFATHGARG